MNTFRTVKDFSDKTDTQLLAKGRKVHQDLTGNVLFTTPVPPLSELKTKLDEYEVAISNAANGGTHLTAARREKRAEVIDILQRLATYVDLTSSNSESVLLGTGFDVYSTEHVDAPASEKPSITGAEDGPLSGEVYIYSSSMKHALTNELRYTKDSFGPDARWTKLNPQSKATFLVTGLETGVNHWFQTRTNSRKGTSDWSDPFQFMPR